MSGGIDADVLIMGGGVAGLWTAHALQRAGYSVVLKSKGPLGDGQTIASQGIIHGGVKYALTGQAGAASSAIAEMPEIWSACLQGRGEIDLRAVTILSPRQYLWTTSGIGSKLIGLAASKAIRTPVHALEHSEWPPEFTGASGINIYAVDEVITDPRSLIAALARNIHIVDHAADVRARITIWCAGAGNPDERMQLRPLHMAMVRSAPHAKLPLLYGHCLAASLSDKPRITITSQHDAQGRVVWYIGGAIAESGIDRSPSELIAHAKRELAACVPWIDLGGTQWATLRVDRAEGLSADGKRPDEPVIQHRENELIIWPTKLAFAPLAAARVVDAVRQTGPSATAPADNREVQPSSIPVATLPWNREDVQWT